MRRHPLWLTVLLVLALAVSGVAVHAHAMGGAAQSHAALAACDGGACDPGGQHHHHGPDPHRDSVSMSCASAIGHCAGAAGALATLPAAIGPAGSPFERPAAHARLTDPLPDADTPPPRI